MRNNDNRTLFATIENVIDMFLNFGAVAMAYLFAAPIITLDVPFTPTKLVAIMFVIVVFQSFTFMATNMYRPIPFVKAYYMLVDIIKVNVIYYVFALLLGVIFFGGEREDFVLLWFLFAGIISTALLIFKKKITINIVAALRKRNYRVRKVIIVGDNTAAAREFVKQVSGNLQSGMMVLGYVGQKIDNTVGVDKLGVFTEFESILKKYKPTDVVFAIDAYDKRHLIRLVNMCDDRCVKVYFIPVIYGFFKSTKQIESVGSLPVINIHSTPLDIKFNAFIKRCVDIIGSLILIVATFPIMLVAAIGVYLSSPGPIFFKQERVGKLGKRFTMLKFRSMKVNTESEVAWTVNDDPRKTKFGNFIRKTAIDELPQLFNVLLGHMSLVGPRPEIPSFVEHFKEIIPLYMVKHYVKPGMTGLAQVKGLRGDTSVEDRISADISYIENWSFLMDIAILLKTPFKAFNKNEVYINHENDLPPKENEEREQPKEEPKGEPKEEPKGEPKEEPKKEPKKEPKEEPKSEA